MAEPGPGDTGLTRPPAISWADYSTGWAALHAGLDPRQAKLFMRTWLRLSYLVGRGLARVGASPSAITWAGLAASALVPLAVLPRGWWLLVAAVLVVLSTVADSVDGAVAVLTARTSRWGGYLDSAADRVAEAAWLLAFWLVGAPGPLVVACGALAWLLEYLRARAGAVGMRGAGAITVAERPTRVIIVVLGFVAGAVLSLIDGRLAAGALTILLAVWTLLGLFGVFSLHRAIRAALRVHDTPFPKR